MEQKRRFLLFFFLGICILCFSVCCDSATKAPEINGESAYRFVKENLQFGVRPSGSIELQQSGDWIIKTAETYSGKYKISEDRFTADTPLGKKNFRNIVIDWDAGTDEYVIIAAHYDTKHFTGFRFIGANDGASGTGVLLAIHEQIFQNSQSLPIGIRLVFFDGEECVTSYGDNDGLWGSRHLQSLWEKSNELSKCKGMILLDMVGDKDLKYTISSDTPEYLKKLLYDNLKKEGKEHLVQFLQNRILDDHVPFQNKKIPAIDLIDFVYGPNNVFWHTESDTLDKISQQSLKTTGDLALRMVWEMAK